MVEIAGGLVGICVACILGCLLFILPLVVIFIVGSTFLGSIVGAIKR